MSMKRKNFQVARTKNNNKGSEEKKLKFESQLKNFFNSIFVSEQSKVQKFIHLSKTNTSYCVDQKELTKLNNLLKTGETSFHTFVTAIYFILFVILLCLFYYE